MTESADKSGANRPKVSVSERGLLVAHGQSQKLAAIRNRLQPTTPVEALPLAAKALLPGLKPEVETELDKARTLLDQRIEHIMRSFPEGKKNRLFGFRYGSVAAIKAMPIKTAFKTLGMSDDLVNMRLVAELDCHGRAVH